MNAKKKQLRQEDYLEHMLDAVRLARSYVEGLSKEDFLTDKKTQQAVILNIVVIGEAATHHSALRTGSSPITNHGLPVTDFVSRHQLS